MSENLKSPGTPSSNPDIAGEGNSLSPGSQIADDILDHYRIEIVQENGEEVYCCVHCGRKIKITAKMKSKWNLRRHMKNIHSEILTQSSTVVPFEFSEHKFRTALLRWVVVADQPFTEPEKEPFMNVLRSLNPMAPKISNDTIKRDLMDAFKGHQKSITELLQAATGKISFAHDVWTSRNCLDFMAVRAHWISREWTHESALVDFFHLEEGHSGKSLCNLFTTSLGRVGVELKKLMGVTMDNATSNDTFMDVLENVGNQVNMDITNSGNRVRCLAHILNLAVQDLLGSLKINAIQEFDDDATELEEDETDDEEDAEDEEYVEDPNEPEFVIEEPPGDDLPPTQPIFFIMKKLRILVKKIRKSPILRKKLRKICKIQNVKPLVPIIDVKTRWNSTFKMLVRAEQLKVPLLNLCSGVTALTNFVMHEGEWQVIKILTNLLSKFNQATELMSMGHHPTISSYIPILDWLQSTLQDFTAKNDQYFAVASAKAFEKLNKYKPKVETSEIPFLATVLDPSLKLSYFTASKYKSRDVSAIKKLLTESYQNYQSEPQSDSDSGDTEGETEDDFFAYLSKRTKLDKSSEIQKYLAHAPVGKGIDVLWWWKLNEKEYPVLARLARDILGVCSSSVCVERDFSAPGHLVTPERPLDPSTITATMCLKMLWK